MAAVSVGTEITLFTTESKTEEAGFIVHCSRNMVPNTCYDWRNVFHDKKKKKCNKDVMVCSRINMSVVGFTGDYGNYIFSCVSAYKY